MSGEFSVGTIVSGTYRIISVLGQGGMGLTYRAWDLTASRPVVLKHPRREMLEKPGFVERFYREARMMAALSHPHVVRITTIGEHEGVPYLVMPFLPGGSLLHHRSRDKDGRPKPMLPSTLHLWLPQIAQALDHVHSSGIVHRDVKPANVFFNGFWHAYLGDFGIAKIVGETSALEKEQTLTATSMVVGTHEYMAPEMFAPKATVTGRADQYALGVMVYEIVAGRRPFTGDKAHLIVEVTTQRIPSLRDMQLALPESLETAVYRALAKRPEARFESCGDFVRSALADVPGMEDEPGLARLACPGCGNVLKVKDTVAGRLGRCPRCQQEMWVAHDFSALWLLGEEVDTSAPLAVTPLPRPQPLPAQPLHPKPESPDPDRGAPSPMPDLQSGRRQPTPRPWSTKPPVVGLAVLSGLATLFLVAAIAQDWGTAALRAELSRALADIRRTEKKLEDLSRAHRDLKKEKEALEQMKRKSDFFATFFGDENTRLKKRLRALQPNPIPDLLVNSIDMPLLEVAPGTFIMGEPGDANEPPHSVRLTKPFYLGAHEVTNAQWNRVMGNVPSQLKDDDLPVHNVSWDDADDFCKKLSNLPEERAKGRAYRLPTEAEWEYACRGGTKTKYSFGDAAEKLGDYGWFADNSTKAPHSVVEKAPNQWGFYDMHGNVWEWCCDWFEPYQTALQTDPRGAHTGNERIVRGGSWKEPQTNCRSANRSKCDPKKPFPQIGFRVAMDVTTLGAHASDIPTPR